MIKKTFTSCILLKSEIENTSLRAYAKNVSSKELKLPSLFYKEFFFFLDTHFVILNRRTSGRKGARLLGTKCYSQGIF